MIYGNKFINEQTILEQNILNEMHFSKKDLQDPKTIEKIYKTKFSDVIFKSIKLMIDILLFLVTCAFGVMTLGFGFIIGAIIWASVHTTLSAYIPNKNDKNLDKFEEKCKKCISISEEHIKNGKNISENKKVIENCKKVLELIKQKRVELQDQKLQALIEAYIGAFKNLDLFINSETVSKGEGASGEYEWEEFAEMFILASELGLSEDKISNILSSKKSNCGYNTFIKNMFEHLENNIIEEKISELETFNIKEFKNKEDITIIFEETDEMVRNIIYLKSTKSFYDIYLDYKNNLHFSKTKLYDYFDVSRTNENVKKAIERADAKLGYYTLSECPKNLEKKPLPFKI